MPLSSLMKSHVFPLGHVWDMNHCFVQRIHMIMRSLPVSHMGAFSMIRSTIWVSQCSCSSPFILLHNGPKPQK